MTTHFTTKIVDNLALYRHVLYSPALALYLVILGGWMNRQQQEVIEYLKTENQVLKEKLGTKRILLNDDQRKRLAVKGKVLGR